MMIYCLVKGMEKLVLHEIFRIFASLGNLNRNVNASKNIRRQARSRNLSLLNLKG